MLIFICLRRWFNWSSFMRKLSNRETNSCRILLSRFIIVIIAVIITYFTSFIFTLFTNMWFLWFCMNFFCWFRRREFWIIFFTATASFFKNSFSWFLCLNLNILNCWSRLTNVRRFSCKPTWEQNQVFIALLLCFNYSTFFPILFFRLLWK